MTSQQTHSHRGHMIPDCFTGAVPDMPADVYHADPRETPSLSASIAAVLVGRSPAHAYDVHPRLGGRRREPTSAMETGAIIHALLLGGQEICVVDAPDWRTKAAREARDHARANGALPVLEESLRDAREIARIANAALEDAGLALTGQSELSVFWKGCRGRFDHMVGNTIIDVKTGRSANPLHIARSVEAYGYDIQAAAYIEAAETIWPEKAGRITYKWLFVETEPPYVTTIAEPTGELLELGATRWGRAKDSWSRCLEAGTWPGYGHARIAPVPWALQREIES